MDEVRVTKDVDVITAGRSRASFLVNFADRLRARGFREGGEGAHRWKLEGCVNETLAAVEAQTARTLAEPEAVRDALRLIEGQESEHASLAFAFVSWASSSGGPKVRDAVRSAFVLAGGQIRMAPSPLEGEQDAMLAHATDGYPKLSASSSVSEPSQS